MADSDDSFVSRWSQRKRARQSGALERDKVQVVPEAPDGGEAAPRETEASDELVASLPDIDTLTEESDFTVFLQEGVPDALRRKALRRLWRLNPVFANLDGLNDYDEDFTLATSALQGAVKTIYQVGKGMVDPDETETAPEAADDAARVEEARTIEASSPDRTLDTPEEESSLETAADDGAAADSAVPVAAEPAAAATRAAGKPTAPASNSSASNSSAAKRRWGPFKS